MFEDFETPWGRVLTVRNMSSADEPAHLRVFCVDNNEEIASLLDRKTAIGLARALLAAVAKADMAEAMGAADEDA